MCQIMGWNLHYTTFILLRTLCGLHTVFLRSERVSWHRTEQFQCSLRNRVTNIWPSEGPAYHHTSVFCHLSSTAQPAPNNDILCRTIVLHCYLYTPPSTLHPKRLLDFSLSQIAFDSTASTNCSHWKPWDGIGCTSGRCLWMFFYFGYLSADKVVASTGYTVFRAQSCALEALLM